MKPIKEIQAYRTRISQTLLALRKENKIDELDYIALEKMLVPIQELIDNYSNLEEALKNCKKCQGCSEMRE